MEGNKPRTKTQYRLLKTKKNTGKMVTQGKSMFKPHPRRPKREKDKIEIQKSSTKIRII